MTTPLPPDLWPQPMCGVLYPLEKVLGDPVLCDRNSDRNSETGFEWW